MPFAIRGVIWYQGETNALRSWDYQRLMTAMILRVMCMTWRGMA